MSDAKKQLPYIVVGIILVAAAFTIGMLYTKVQVLEQGLGGAPGIAGNGTSPTPTQPSTSAENLDPVSDNDWIKGNRNAPVALVEYSDFECPFCKSFHPTAQRVVDEYGDNFMWVYRHFPLDSLHPNARKVSEAAECSGQQNGNSGFWAFTDRIYELTPDRTGYTMEQMLQVAEGAGLNLASFEACLNSGEMAAKVEAHYQSGIRAGVTGTPGNILVNMETGETRLLPGAVPYDQLKMYIDQMLEN
jgi:protein-disulfide isomerase